MIYFFKKIELIWSHVKFVVNFAFDPKLSLIFNTDVKMFGLT